MVDVRQSLIDAGWKQGALIEAIPDDRFKALAHINLEETDQFLVISQTCDLVNPDFEAEPYCEVLRLKPQDEEPTPDTSGGKNSRVLEFSSAIEGEHRFYQVLPFERFFVHRDLLLEFAPDKYVEEEAIELVSAWLTKRLIRTAFPDTFDRRWKNRRKQIENIIKRLERVRDIYLKIEPFSELEDDQEYALEITLLMNAEDFDDPEVHAEYLKHKDALEGQFAKCPNIDLQVIELASDAEITLRELQALRRWDYSYLSYREPEPHAMPVTLEN